MIHRVPRSQEVKSLPKKQRWPRLQKNKTCNTSESGSAMTSTSGCNEGRFLDRPLSWHPSPPLFFYSPLYPPFLWRPSGPHQGSVCSSHMWGVSAYPTRINQPLNVRIFVYVLIPAPPNPLSPSLTYLCPIDENWFHSQLFPPPWSGLLRALTAQFYALLLRLLHGEQSRQRICEDTDGNELALCLVLTYRRNHVVKSVGQAFNKRKGQNV